MMAPATSSTTRRRRVLVTGGAGFIGSHLCERLLASGHAVLCVDDLSSGDAANIDHLRERADSGAVDFETMRHDIVAPLDAEVDAIYNLACPASPLAYQRHPVQTTKTAVYGAINMLDLARRRDARIFQASTSEVYGEPAEHPQSERYWGNVNPIGPRACYDEGKRCAETVFFDYHRRYGVPIRVARIFNTYGPRMAIGDGRVIPAFILAALKGEALTVFGDGRQTRSFCYIDDMVDFVVALMDCAGDVAGPMNLGNADEVAIIDLARTIIDITGTKSRLAFRALPENDPLRRRPDLGLMQATLGLKPRVSLGQGLAATVEYFDRLLSGADLPGEGALLAGAGGSIACRSARNP